MVDKFITYKEDLNGFDQSIQNQILNECVASWKRKNFKTSVLSRRDAENFSKFEFKNTEGCRLSDLYFWGIKT